MPAPKITIETPFVNADLGTAFCSEVERLPEVAFAYFSFDTGMTYVICKDGVGSSQLHEVWTEIQAMKARQNPDHFSDSSWSRNHLSQIPPDHNHE